MDFSLTQTQLDIKQSILKFATSELNSDLIENDEKGTFPRNGWEKCARMGLFGLPIPEQYGGLNENLLTTVLAIEALGEGCQDSGLVHSIVTQILCVLQISHFGNDLQKRKYLSQMCKGDMVCAQAITEPNSGSDALSMHTRAVKNSETYIIDGTKMFISNGPIADLILVFALTNPNTGTFAATSCFMVEGETRGLTLSKPLNKMGLRTLQNGEIVLEQCSVPAESLLGSEGQGWLIFNEALQLERTLLFACHLGIMERIIKKCVDYAKARQQFGQPIGKFQSISNKIADMKVASELGRLILYKSAWLKDRKKRANLETSIAKLFISESLKQACMDAIQIHGAYGYMKEFQIERDFRDSIASTLYSGTSEVQRNIIATLVGL
jgi:alkylation response protein AidB-like acyl-CoA dehydrogenase